MTAEQYLRTILAREAVDVGPNSAARQVQRGLQPILQRWAPGALLDVSPSGSFAKGTANKSGTDIDLFVSISETASETLSEIYNSLHQRMVNEGFTAKKQNVSINIRVGTLDVDLVPGKRQSAQTGDHSLYRRRADTWTKTNVARHIAHVRQFGRIDESRLVKLWRTQNNLEFPSFYIELIVIDALQGSSPMTLDERVWRVLQFIHDSIETRRVVDPANTNNIISDDLTQAEKTALVRAARRALAAKDWAEIVR